MQLIRWGVSEAPSLGVFSRFKLLLVKEYATYVKFHTGSEM